MDDETVIQRLAAVPRVSPVGSMLEERIDSAKVLLKQFDEASIPAISKVVTKGPEDRKGQAIIALGVLGIAHNATSAVPVLIKFVESYEGKSVSRQENAWLFYAQISLAQIGTPQAREFLYRRISSEYWRTHRPHHREGLDEREYPPEFFNRRTAIQALGYMETNEAEHFLRNLLRSPEFRDGKPHFTGSTYDPVDMRVAVEIALEDLVQEKRFRQALVDFVTEKRFPQQPSPAAQASTARHQAASPKAVKPTSSERFSRSWQLVAAGALLLAGIVGLAVLLKKRRAQKTET